MDNRYYKNVIAGMDSFLKENGFVADGEIFKNETKALKVEYNDARQMYILNIADISEGEIGEFSEASAWLFDDSQNEKDAEYVSIDFVDTLRKNMGIKVARVGGVVDLPAASKGDVMDISGFAKKVLDVYPQFKDLYKEHVAKYGNFLYMKFFGETFVLQIKQVVSENNKKAVKKLLELCENAYIAGDRDTVNTVVACLAAAAYGDDDTKAKILEMLSENNHFKMSVESFIPMLKNKKISDLLIK